jgi:hypothetical protein
MPADKLYRVLYACQLLLAALAASAPAKVLIFALHMPCGMLSYAELVAQLCACSASATCWHCHICTTIHADLQTVSCLFHVAYQPDDKPAEQSLAQGLTVLQCSFLLLLLLLFAAHGRTCRCSRLISSSSFLMISLLRCPFEKLGNLRDLGVPPPASLPSMLPPNDDAGDSGRPPAGSARLMESRNPPFLGEMALSL